MELDPMLNDFIQGKSVLAMPANLYLLTPYFTFNFVDLPGDY
jgi:hypothetical protein